MIMDGFQKSSGELQDELQEQINNEKHSSDIGQIKNEKSDDSMEPAQKSSGKSPSVRTRRMSRRLSTSPYTRTRRQSERLGGASDAIASTSMMTPPSSNESSPTVPEQDSVVTVHVTGLMCPICEKKEPNQSSLRNHMDMHKGLKPFPCPLCGRAYETEFQLLGHATQKHQHDPVFKCGGCDRVFTTQKYLQNHQRSKRCRDVIEIDICDSD